MSSPDGTGGSPDSSPRKRSGSAIGRAFDSLRGRHSPPQLDPPAVTAAPGSPGRKNSGGSLVLPSPDAAAAGTTSSPLRRTVSDRNLTPARRNSSPAPVAIEAPPTLPTLVAESTAADHVIKLVLLGRRSSGKTSFFRRCIVPNAPLPRRDEPTPGIDKKSYLYVLPNHKRILINMWDCQAEMMKLGSAEMRTYMRDAQAAVVLYDDSEMSSLEVAETYTKEVKQASIQFVMLFFNIRFNKMVSDMQFFGENLMRRHGVLFHAGNIDTKHDSAQIAFNDFLGLLFYVGLSSIHQKIISDLDIIKKLIVPAGYAVTRSTAATQHNGAIYLATQAPDTPDSAGGSSSRRESSFRRLRPASVAADEDDEDDSEPGPLKRCMYGLFCCYWCCTPKEEQE